MASKAYFRTATVTASLLLAFALSVAAGTYSSLADQWNAGLQKVDQELREKNWQAAKKEVAVFYVLSVNFKTKG
jgi:VIT1/CCC1 family predicted Fe2+/Mn2+ transporter